MTKKRTGDPWMPADEYGRGLPVFTINLIVRDVARALPFYTKVLGASVEYSDPDFAAVKLGALQFMLHADHAYDQHPWYPARMSWARLLKRVFDIDTARTVAAA